MDVSRDFDTSRVCTLNVGGRADFYVRAKDEQELMDALDFASSIKRPVLVIGLGSNVFFSDKGFRGILVRFFGTRKEFEIREDKVSIKAWMRASSIVRILGNYGIGGLEFLANIPGTIGGTIACNAGTKAGSISDVILGARLLDLRENKVFEVGSSFFDFGGYIYLSITGTDNMKSY